MKALIKVGYGCNDHCTFCHTLDVRHIDGEAADVHAKIERAKALGHSMVVLSGGEPTIRPELVAWAEHVARLGMGFGLVTNGRMLAYREVTEKLLAARLEYVYLSMHGGTRRVHDLVVRSQAFDETYGALANLTGRGVDLTVNCVITKQNLPHLRGVVDAVAPYPDARIKFSMVEPKGGGDKLFEHIVPRAAEVAERVLDALEHGERTLGSRARLRHGGVPLCLLPGWEGAWDDLRTHGFRSMVEVWEPDYFPVDDLNKLQPSETCEGCALRGPCPGIYRGYYDAFGAAELRPRREGARGNSFDWTYERMVATNVAGDACPIRDDGVTPWDRGRDLFVRHDGKLALYRADGRDFADTEIAAVKHARGQIYLDASRGKDAPDDFARELVPLARSSGCEPCAERERCTGTFEPRFEDVFGEADARVRAMLGELAGDVLDVGCGHGPYDDLLASAAARGSMRYVGIDPDAARIEGLRARREWASLRVGRAEDLDEDAAYDAVLVLRSWNHFEDPERAARRIVRALRPHGTLVVADDLPFGLARTRAQTERARRGGAALEHHRLDGPDEALRWLGGMVLRERLDVAPGTSTLWALALEKPA